MKFQNKLILGFFLLIILAISVFYYLLKIANISYFDSNENVESEIVRGNIEIYRDYYGIPLIKTEYDEDFYFAMGYEHASSRLWQMDYTRRIAQGRLSEIFGERTLKVDIFFRNLELEKIADSLILTISPKSLEILNNYSAGINEFINSNSKRLSFEFGTLDYLPEEWLPKHSLMIGRTMAFEMSLSFWIESAYADIAAKYDLEFAKQFIPNHDETAPKVLSKELSEYNLNYFESLKNDTANALKSFGFLSNDLLELRNLLNWQGSGTGSNSWVANKLLNDSMGAILANDPHLSLSLPARWAFMQIISPSKHILGFSIPGVPAFVIGRNEEISWGITNVMADICDFYVEKIDSSGKKYYRNESQLFDLQLTKDTIIIKEQNPYIYYKKSTSISNIISDAHLFNDDSDFLNLKAAENKSPFYDKYAVTYNWAPKFQSDEILAADKLLNASSFAEFDNALQTWGFPALNFSYGDSKGNIGIKPTGYIPLRDELCEPNLPNPAWEANRGWLGLHKNKIPSIYNPDRNFVLSANNKTGDDIPFYISNHWEPESRAIRIEEMLEILEKYSVRDAEIMQLDVLSPYARDLCSIALPILQSLTKIMSSNEKAALQLIQNWDYIISSAGPEAAIYNSFFEKMISNTFYDELGERIYREYTFVASVPTRKLLELLKSGDNVIFDDIKTTETENINYVIYKSFNEAIRELIEIFDSSDMSKWNWGELHILQLKHPFSENEFLAPSVTYSPLMTGGNNTTVNNTEYKIFRPYEVVLGASLRFIADMNDSTVQIALPGGISGDAISPNYTNQVQLWLNGGYIKIPFSKYPSENYKLDTFISSK